MRQIAPGQPVTHDYRDNRVTLETDPASGRVLRATCGKVAAIMCSNASRLEQELVRDGKNTTLDHVKAMEEKV